MESMETNQTVEVSGAKFRVHELERKYRRCVFNTEEIPPNVFVPIDSYQIRIALEDIVSYKRITPRNEYIEKDIDPNEL